MNPDHQAREQPARTRRRLLGVLGLAAALPALTLAGLRWRRWRWPRRGGRSVRWIGHL